MEEGDGTLRRRGGGRWGRGDVNDCSYSTTKLLVLIPIVSNPPPFRAASGGNQARVLMIHCAGASQPEPEDATVF